MFKSCFCWGGGGVLSLCAEGALIKHEIVQTPSELQNLGGCRIILVHSITSIGIIVSNSKSMIDDCPVNTAPQPTGENSVT